jgi:hypothetical protein
MGEVAELESMLVSNPYGNIGRELEVQATVKGLGDSDGLDLHFWADTPSGRYEKLAEINKETVSWRRGLLHYKDNSQRDMILYRICKPVQKQPEDW